MDTTTDQEPHNSSKTLANQAAEDPIPDTIEEFLMWLQQLTRVRVEREVKVENVK